MTRDILEIIVGTSVIIEIITIIALMASHIFFAIYPNKVNLKKIKIGFVIGFVTQTIISITSAKVIAFFYIIPWIVAYAKIHKYSLEKEEMADKCENIVPKYLLIKQQIAKGKVRVIEVPYDEVKPI